MGRAEEIAAGLSEAQRAYLLAVAAAGRPYEPRHHRTANWACRHGYVETIVEKAGKRYRWGDLPDAEFKFEGVTLLGQVLTPLGLAVCRVLEGQ